MKHLTFSNGESMPILGLGTWQMPPDKIASIFTEAIKFGYRHIDCAMILSKSKNNW